MRPPLYKGPNPQEQSVAPLFPATFVKMRPFVTSASTRSMLLSIRYRSKGAYDNNPEADEIIRKDVGERLREEGLGGLEGVAEIS